MGSKAKALLHQFGASDFKDLFNRVYMEVDQYLMRTWMWDYQDQECGLWLTNKIYCSVKELDQSSLSEEDREWCNELMWFWNHHAISCAIWRYYDLDAARQYAATALVYQDFNHPNKITPLFALLLDEKWEEAELLASTIHEAEKEAAELLIKSYWMGWRQISPAT